ncbi:3827_t:CDS:2 [Cetraspora pellucida]|uniref:3827_t:CDS:1 n=1 Tax=Cetraspora pellucida TaxID=1433469 RepID=A0A9N9CAX4_9GLOM|nr:3827_t:CDS:2 [Cetraspora pellucida]
MFEKKEPFKDYDTTENYNITEDIEYEDLRYSNIVKENELDKRRFFGVNNITERIGLEDKSFFNGIIASSQIKSVNASLKHLLHNSNVSLYELIEKSNFLFKTLDENLEKFLTSIILQRQRDEIDQSVYYNAAILRDEDLKKAIKKALQTKVESQQLLKLLQNFIKNEYEKSDEESNEESDEEPKEKSEKGSDNNKENQEIARKNNKGAAKNVMM